MRYEPISPQLFIENRKRLAGLLPANALAVVNANDNCPTNADGTQGTIVNSDLFYLTGVEQEQTILVLYPDADESEHRELLFLREPTPENELWEGHKLQLNRPNCGCAYWPKRRELYYVALNRGAPIFLTLGPEFWFLLFFLSDSLCCFSLKYLLIRISFTSQ